MTALKDRLGHSSSASPSLTSNVQPQAGTYTKEALRELQKNTRTLVSSRPSSESKPSSAEPIVVLKGLVKPADSIGNEAGKLDSDDDDDGSEEKGGSLFSKDKDDAEARLASMGIGKGRDRDRDSSGSLIPDQATINAIRAKRERLRQSRAAAPDYISLDGGSNHGAAEGLSDEEPENLTRIAMIGEKMDGAKKGVFDVDDREMDLGLRKEISEEDEEDEEEKIWEEEQFRKGLGKRVDDGVSRVGSNAVPVVQSVPQQKFIRPAVSQNVPASTSIGGALGASQGLGMMSISQQAEIARKALQDNVRRLKVWKIVPLIKINFERKYISSL